MSSFTGYITPHLNEKHSVTGITTFVVPLFTDYFTTELNGNNTSAASNTSTFKRDEPQESSYALAFLVILFLFGVTTFVSNIPSILIVVATFIRKRKFKFINILCLSITDALLGLSWLLMIETLNGSLMSFASCCARSFVLIMSFKASTLQVFGICLERLLIVCWNFTILKENKNMMSMCTVIISWAISCFLTCLMFVFGTVPYDDARICSFSSIFGEKQKEIFGQFAIFMGSIQIAVFANMTFLLIYLVRHHNNLDKQTVRPIKKSDIRICTTIGIIAATFFIVNTPITIVYLLEGYYSGMESSRVIRNVAFLLAGLNSAINHFFYMFRIKKIRQLLVDSVTCPIPYKKMKSCESNSRTVSSQQQSKTTNI